MAAEATISWSTRQEAVAIAATVARVMRDFPVATYYRDVLGAPPQFLATVSENMRAQADALINGSFDTIDSAIATLLHHQRAIFGGLEELQDDELEERVLSDIDGSIQTLKGALGWNDEAVAVIEAFIQNTGGNPVRFLGRVESAVPQRVAQIAQNASQSFADTYTVLNAREARRSASELANLLGVPESSLPRIMTLVEQILGDMPSLRDAYGER